MRRQAALHDADEHCGSVSLNLETLWQGKTREVDGVAYITHRNLTGIFNESTVNTFNSIAKTMIETNGISDLIANVQLAPKAVVSVIYPLVETRNLSSGQILAQNNNGAIGHDLLNDPARVAIARATVRVAACPQIVPWGPNLCHVSERAVTLQGLARLIRC